MASEWTNRDIQLACQMCVSKAQNGQVIVPHDLEAEANALLDRINEARVPLEYVAFHCPEHAAP